MPPSSNFLLKKLSSVGIRFWRRRSLPAVAVLLISCPGPEALITLAQLSLLTVSLFVVAHDTRTCRSNLLEKKRHGQWARLARFKSFLQCYYSLVHSYIVISVFLGLVSGLLLVHLALVPFSPFPLPTYLFCHSVI